MNNVTDLIIRIKNAAMARRKEVLIPYSKLNKTVLLILQKERFLQDVKEETSSKGQAGKSLTATIRYVDRIPVITDCEIISRPSLRRYKGIKAIVGGKRKLGVTIISTSHGVMTQQEAKKKGVGGELLFRVW